MMVQYALKKCSPGRIYHFHAARKYRLAACRAWFFAFASALGLFQGISLSRATTGAAADFLNILNIQPNLGEITFLGIQEHFSIYQKRLKNIFRIKNILVFLVLPKK